MTRDMSVLDFNKQLREVQTASLSLVAHSVPKPILEAKQTNKTLANFSGRILLIISQGKNNLLKSNTVAPYCLLT